MNERGKKEENSDTELNNFRVGRMLELQEEVARQKELELLRGKRIRQEQAYIDRMNLDLNEQMRENKEERKYNEAFEERIRDEVYDMHGISEDKLTGMSEYRNAWYQGAAFALFFLSLLLFVLCGVLHGFGSKLSVFMALYTAIEGTLLPNGRKRAAFFEVLAKAVYFLLFPVMMIVFVCYELEFEEYSYLVPIFTVAGVIVLVIGTFSYFIYDPYRADRKKRKKAERYIREMERDALKEVRLKEKALGKQERAREKQEAKAIKKQERQAARIEKKAAKKEKRHEKKEKIAEWWKEKLPKREVANVTQEQSVTDEPKEQESTIEGSEEQKDIIEAPVKQESTIESSEEQKNILEGSDKNKDATESLEE